MGNGANDQAWARVTGLRLFMLLGLLCALQLFANRSVLDHDWVDFDDDINVILNPHLTGGTADTFKWAWTDATYTRRYMPLGWLMFDTLFRLGGLNPVIYHAASWLLAAGNAIALMLIIRHFISAPDDQRRKTGWEDVCAASVAALFSVHPLRAETAGWASALVYQGSTLLAALAVLVSFPTSGAPPRRGFALLGHLLFLSSLLLYPVCLGLPLILILAAGCSRARESWSAVAGAIKSAARRYAGWLVIAAAICALNLFAAATSRTFSALDNLQHYSPVERVTHSARMLGHMVTQLVWPGLTSPYYGDLAAASPARKFIVPAALAVALVALLAIPRTRKTALLFLAIGFAAVLPFVGLIDQGQTANDRYSFMLLGVVAVGTAAVLVRAGTPSRRLLAILGLAVAMALGFPAYRRALAIWQNTTTLQARVDLVMSEKPDLRLGFARPAMNDFLRGRYEESRQRLRLGFLHFGEDAVLLNAAGFIEETRTSLTGASGRNPSMPPYAFMHLDLAKKHAAAGHAFAAQAHREYARQLMRLGAEDRQP